MSDFAKILRHLCPLIGERKCLEAAAEAVGRFVAAPRGAVFNLNMPPRLGKSYIATAATAAMLLADPDIRVLRVSYSAELAEAFSVQTQAMYLDFFAKLGVPPPSVSGTRGRWSIGTRTEPSMIACGVSGSVTGFGVDVAIVDDTCKSMADAMSPAWSRTLDIFRESVLLSRLEGQRKILNIGTRWTLNDWFSAWDTAEVFTLPALVGGESVCEEWQTTEELDTLRRRMGDDMFSAQYMQKPLAIGRARLFENWSPRMDAPPDCLPVAVIDPATAYGTDWFVCGFYAKYGGLTYLADMHIDRRCTIGEFSDWLQKRRIAYALCEANGVGAEVVRQLRRSGVPVRAFATKRDKYSRAFAVLDRFESLRINPDIDRKVLQELAAEAAAFPSANVHDDLIDNIVMAFEHL